MEEFAAWFRENVRLDVEPWFHSNNVTINLQMKQGDEWQTVSSQTISIPADPST